MEKLEETKTDMPQRKRKLELEDLEVNNPKWKSAKMSNDFVVYNEIRKNVDYLSEKLTNLTEILLHLIQLGIISENESEEIKSGRTSYEKTDKLLTLIQKKYCGRNLFLDILRNTNNEHCANKIEGKQTEIHLKHPKISKWWPYKKLLIKSLYKRKFGSRLLVEELHDRISKDDNRIVVICESADSSKYSGMGGVGKTLSAKWYAHHHEEYYDHILWIDCGEGRLLTSFKKLSRDLEIKHFDKFLDIEDYSRKSFEALEKWKCLWIFDNAEKYQGDEGIIKILPVEKLLFNCLITSRSREWGVKNIGHGKITDLQLDVCCEEESLEFLKQILDKDMKHTDSQLKELSQLLGNLPLAIELALSALNSRRIDLKNYIKKLHQKSLVFVGSTFEGYEKRINKNIKISLDRILEEENGQLATEILMIFGYIRPDDIQVEFIRQTVNSEEFEQAIELLVKYCLISKEDKSFYNDDKSFYNDDKRFYNDEKNFYNDEKSFYNDDKSFYNDDKSFYNDDENDSDDENDKEIKTVLSIHRLLQQIIRHNGKKRKMERETLRKILGCNGFVEYKLIPFTKYADEKLRREFPKVRAELLDQRQLQKLMWEMKFVDSVQLAMK